MKKCCPVCASREIAEFTKIDKLPILLFPVPGRIKDNIKSFCLIVYKCADCGHVFKNRIKQEDAGLLYKKLYRYYPFNNLESMNSVYRAPFEEFFKKNYLSHRGPKKLLEVGCSFAGHLNFFKKCGIDASGIDLSGVSGSKGKVIRGSYEKYRFKDEFDIIVSRFNLEHLNDINIFFNKAHEDLSQKGLLFIQVPNTEVFIKSRMPLFIAHEHIHYFSIYSLCLAAKNNGFELVDSLSEGSQSIIAVFKKRASGSCRKADRKINRVKNSIYATYLSDINHLKAEVLRIFERNNRICCYGAGLTLCWLLYKLNIADSGFTISVIDDNKFVQGKYMPDSGIEIKNPLEIRAAADAVLMLTMNPVYHKTISGRVRRYGNFGKIYAINNAGLVQLK